MTVTSHSTGPSVAIGVRIARAPRYAITTQANTGSATVDVSLEQGLNEICVFATPPASDVVTEIPEASKRCAWVARP